MQMSSIIIPVWLIWELYQTNLNNTLNSQNTPCQVRYGVPFMNIFQLILIKWYIWASVNLRIICSDNGSSPVKWQVILWTSAGLLSISPSKTKLAEILLVILTFSFTKPHAKVSSATLWSFFLCLNISTHLPLVLYICVSKSGKHWFW